MKCKNYELILNERGYVRGVLCSDGVLRALYKRSGANSGLTILLPCKPSAARYYIYTGKAVIS